MGPQLDSCGRHTFGGPLFEGFVLQWGRNLTVAEGGSLDMMRLRTALLQWGRNLTVAEGRLQIVELFLHPVLQWGRNLTVAEGTIRRKATTKRASFNGAAT